MSCVVCLNARAPAWRIIGARGIRAMESTAHRRYKALGVAEGAQRERQAVCVEAAAQANAIAVLFILTCEDIVGEPSVMSPIIPLRCADSIDRFNCSPCDILERILCPTFLLKEYKHYNFVMPWPSGLRRQIKALVRKSVCSNHTGIMRAIAQLAEHWIVIVMNYHDYSFSC